MATKIRYDLSNNTEEAFKIHIIPGQKIRTLSWSSASGLQDGTPEWKRPIGNYMN